MAVTDQVEAVLDILAPKIALPLRSASAVRVPIIFIDYHGTAVRPDEQTLQALAEQIVTAIRTASGEVDES